MNHIAAKAADRARDEPRGLSRREVEPPGLSRRWGVRGDKPRGSPALLAALAAVAAIVLGGSAVAAVPDEAALARRLQQSMIWVGSAPTGRQAYVVFRKTFSLREKPAAASLRIFADSRYILWINGRYVTRGPCRFDPKRPEYDVLDVKPYLQTGRNALAVLVHHYHDGKTANDSYSPGVGWTPHPFNGRTMRHAPGLTARLDLSLSGGRTETIATDATWRAGTRNRFGPSPISWSSIPDRIDARRDTGDWTLADFDDSGWERAAPVDGSLWGPLRARSIPLLRETDVGPLMLVQGSGRRPLADALPLELTPGKELVIDAGRFVQAYSVLDFEADAGSMLETEHAQRYFDTGRKPTGSYGRVNQYTARAGRQTYTSGDTFGLKYLVIRVKAGRVRLEGVRLVDRVYPFDVVGKFASSDPMLDTIWRYSVNTVCQCSEDAYVDCAVRERTEWMADGYVQSYHVTRVALAGPAGPDGRPRYGDPRLLGNLLRHIGQSAQPDGRVKAHHPSDRWDIHGYIEDYASLWIQAIREYYDYTGDAGLAAELWPVVTRQLQWFLDRRTERGLVLARDFVYPGSNPLCYKVCEGATLNAYVVGALRDAAFLAGMLGHDEQKRQYAAAAEGLARAINRHLWDETSGTYYGGILDGKTHPATVPAAMMCLHFDVVPPQRRQRVRRWLVANCQRYAALPYAYQFLLGELYRMDSDQADQLALDLVRRKWAAMARGETGTVWEGFGPGECCHEAGSVPAYFLSAYVLGVRVERPASKKRILIEPRLADLTRASGVVVTEFGPVPVSWERPKGAKELKFELTIPEGVTATVSLPTRAAAPSLVVDGRPLQPGQDHAAPVAKRSGRHLTFELRPGRHTGSLAP